MIAIELPVSTTIMLRSIAQIAREEGEDLTQSEAALACVEVFALGGRAPGEAALEGSYFAIRSVLAKTVSESARFILQRGLADETAPVLVRLVVQIAARFGLVVSQKLAAQAIPVIGAFGGAAVNLAFTEHFQNIARGHFTVRRLERAYGAEAVRFDYERLRAMNRPPGRDCPAACRSRSCEASALLRFRGFASKGHAGPRRSNDGKIKINGHGCRGEQELRREPAKVWRNRSQLRIWLVCVSVRRIWELPSDGVSPSRRLPSGAGGRPRRLRRLYAGNRREMVAGRWGLCPEAA